MNPWFQVPPQSAAAANGLALAQIVMLVFARAAWERASWNEACRSLAAAVRRLFAVNSYRLGMPSVRMTPTISNVISNS